MSLREDALAAYAARRVVVQELELAALASQRQQLRGLLWSVLALEVDLDAITVDPAYGVPAYTTDDHLWLSLIDGPYGQLLGWVTNCTQCRQIIVLPVTGIAELGSALTQAESGTLLCQMCMSLREELLTTASASGAAAGAATSAQRLVDALRDFVGDYGLSGREIEPIDG